MMEKEFIPLSVPNFKGKELEYVTEAIKTEWVSTGGAFIDRFEKEIAGYTGAGYAVACQSGTSGLHLAMISLGISPGDLVIAPTLTFIAAVNPIRYCGANPVFFDCDDSLCIDSEQIRDFLENHCERAGGVVREKTSGKAVFGIVVVHVFGNIVNMDAIMDISKEYGIPVIEDATEALGSKVLEGRYAGRFAGTIGDIGVFSFNGNKIITTGGGGMIVTNDRDRVEHCRHLSTQAKADPVNFDHDEIGYNYRMTNLQAALGIAQLEQLESFIEIKGRNYRKYKELGVELLDFRGDIRPNYWFYSYLTEDRDGLIKRLGASGIQARPVWRLMHTLKPYQGEMVMDTKRAEYYHSKIVNLPCSSNLTEKQVERVAREILG